jgi:peptidoglycan/xylan/chitin deacetylase (PgdA/CDA1 family)
LTPATVLKHKLKNLLREAYARLLFHTGLHALVDRLMPRRLTILCGHCVEPKAGRWEGGAHLPADMKIAEERLERIVAWIKRRYRMCTIAEGVLALAEGGDGRSLVALSVDDGYRDNHDVLLPLLARQGVPATVFLESRPLDERRVNWTHKLFWILARSSAPEFARDYARAGGPDAQSVERAAAAPGEATYQIKRLLKYDVDPAARDAAIDRVFADLGGDEGALCDALYMTWDQARALRDAGIELGGHTVGHPVLSGLGAEEQEREIARGREALVRELATEPVTFAYPFGRRWDFDATSRGAVVRAGFRTAVTMHAGTNQRGADATALHRLALSDDARLHLLVAEACGGFALARRLGLNLSE